jgi:integrase/recombinase XerD
LVALRHQLGLSEELDPADATPLALNGSRGRLSGSGIAREVAACARRAGIRKDVSPHWARHTFATLALAGGAGLPQVQAALGHSSIAVTSVYLHAAGGLAETAADFLPYSVADHLPFGIQGG